MSAKREELDGKLTRIIDKLGTDPLALDMIVDAVSVYISARGGRPRTVSAVSEVTTGGLYRSSDTNTNNSDTDLEIKPRKPRKHTETSEAFKRAWSEYGRHEEMPKAWLAWQAQSDRLGGEDKLLDLVLAALTWQGPKWTADSWKFAPYFERYLKNARWTDEPLRAPPGRPAPPPIRYHDPKAPLPR